MSVNVIVKQNKSLVFIIVIGPIGEKVVLLSFWQTDDPERLCMYHEHVKFIGTENVLWNPLNLLFRNTK